MIFDYFGSKIGIRRVLPCLETSWVTFRSLILLLLSTHPEPHLPSNKSSLRYSREQHGTPFPRPNFRSLTYVKTADTHITRFCPFVPSLIPSPTHLHTGDSDRMEQRWVCLSTCGLSRGLRGRACHVAPASPRLFPEWLLPPALAISPDTFHFAPSLYACAQLLPISPRAAVSPFWPVLCSREKSAGATWWVLRTSWEWKMP